MIRQQLRTKERKNAKLYNFLEYKRKKPFFIKPIKITIGNPLNATYNMLENVVYKGKQILALQLTHDPLTIILVEAKIKDGQLIQISMLSDEFIGDISRMLKRII